MPSLDRPVAPGSPSSKIALVALGLSIALAVALAAVLFWARREQRRLETELAELRRQVPPPALILNARLDILEKAVSPKGVLGTQVGDLEKTAFAEGTLGSKLAGLDKSLSAEGAVGSKLASLDKTVSGEGGISSKLALVEKTIAADGALVRTVNKVEGSVNRVEGSVKEVEAWVKPLRFKVSAKGALGEAGEDLATYVSADGQLGKRVKYLEDNKKDK